jgi:hypothetical protein
MRKQADATFSTRLTFYSLVKGPVHLKIMLHYWGKQRAYWGKCASSHIVKKCPVVRYDKKRVITGKVKSESKDFGQLSGCQHIIQQYRLMLLTVYLKIRHNFPLASQP